LGLLTEAGADVGILERRFPGSSWSAVRLLPGSRALSPRTSSVGRLFDAAASLAGLVQVNAFEGQAAMALEHAAESFRTEEEYPFALTGEKPIVLDWAPAVRAMVEDAAVGVSAGLIASRFHNGLAEAVLEVAVRCGLERVVLTGGVFQNASLAERCSHALEGAGFTVFMPERLPPNDGGISAGQAFLAGSGWGTTCA
jgi:hydrogenase maturation protein HypF